MNVVFAAGLIQKLILGIVYTKLIKHPGHKRLRSYVEYL